MPEKVHGYLPLVALSLGSLIAILLIVVQVFSNTQEKDWDQAWGFALVLIGAGSGAALPSQRLRDESLRPPLAESMEVPPEYDETGRWRRD